MFTYEVKCVVVFCLIEDIGIVISPICCCGSFNGLADWDEVKVGGGFIIHLSYFDTNVIVFYRYDIFVVYTLLV